VWLPGITALRSPRLHPLSRAVERARRWHDTSGETHVDRDLLQRRRRKVSTVTGTWSVPDCMGRRT
jgi:hypothetical protein